MNSQHYNRFKDLPWFKELEKSRIMVGGAGGIGSHLTFMLSRAGAETILIDNDTVEEVNLAGQLFGKEDIGKTKVQAVSDVVTRLCGENKVSPLNTKVTEEEGQWRDLVPSCNVVCAVFDNIKARQIMYDRWYANSMTSPTLFVDGRMSAENGQVFVFHSGNLLEPGSEAYKEHFFDDSLVADQPCTMKATTHCGSLLASLIVSQITNWTTNQLARKDDAVMERNLIDLIEFHLPLMLLKSINLNQDAVVTEVQE